MKKDNLKTGQIGEQMAREYLAKHGYEIMAQNVRTKYAEIDVVVKYKTELVFVEVRTKRGEQFGTPEESLNRKKLNKLWWNARGYANYIHWDGPYRIDAICVVLDHDNSPARLTHHQNIV